MTLIYLILYLIIFFLILFIYFKLLRNSIFGINFIKNSFTGFFIIFDYLIFVFPATIIMLIASPEDIWVAFKVEPEIIPFVGLFVNIQYIFLMLIFYILTISFNFFRLPPETALKSDDSTAISLLIWLSSYCIFSIFVSIIVFDGQHALYASLTSGDNLFLTRSQTEAHPVMRYVKFSSLIMIPAISFLIGYIKKLSISLRMLFVFILIYIATFGGDKSAMIYPIIMIFIGYISRVDFALKIKPFLFLAPLLILFFSAIYFVVVEQYPGLQDLDAFFNYISQRVFVAQLIGVYEQFSLNLSDFEYIFKALPIPSSLYDFKSYHKDLMIISEDILDYDSIGIKNTLFVAEAHAIGGLLLSFFSPLFYAIPFSISFLLLKKVFQSYLPDARLSTALSAITFFYFQRTTGGFTEILLFKNFLLIMLTLLPCFLLIHLFNRCINY